MPAEETVPGGSPQAGARLIASFHCGACHMIPGIRGADGLVGPPLLLFGRRTYIAGELPNTPPNLIRWIRNPPAIEPRTAMPALGLSERQARDVAAYLYTLR
jgi:cytochrome c